MLAADQSAAAVASATATAAANGLADRIRVIRDDAAGSLPDGSVDLVVCNPPFHLGAAVVTTAADRLFAAAGRVLRPGGELWTVYNSALRYKPTLSRLVGPTRVVEPDPEVHRDGLHAALTLIGRVSDARRAEIPTTFRFPL